MSDVTEQENGHEALRTAPLTNVVPVVSEAGTPPAARTKAPAPATARQADVAATTTTAVGWDAVVQVLAAVVTGAGLLGFVALFGGAILFARAERFDLPAAQAVALRPKSELLATGGQFLVGAMLIALGAIVVLWLVSRFVSSSSSWLFNASYRKKMQTRRDAASGKHRVALEAQLRTQSAMDAADAALETARKAYNAAREETQGAQEDLSNSALYRADASREAAPFEARMDELTGTELVKARSALDKRDAAEEHHRIATAALKQRQEHEAAMERERMDAESAAATAAAELAQREKELAAAKAATDGIDVDQKRNVETRVRFSRYAILGLTLLLAELLLLALGNGIGVNHWLILVLVSAVTSTMAVLVYHHTGRFVWFGVSAFLAIAVFNGWVLNYSIQDNPKIEPAAALVAGQTPMTGAYVTQTNDRIYLGLQRGDPLHFDLVSVPRADVVRLMIGPLTPPRGVEGATRRMVAQLCAEKPVAPAPKRPAPRC